MDSKKNPTPTPQQQHAMLLHHIILPRFLPQEKSTHFHLTELQLMRQMVQTVYDLSKKLPTPTVNLFVRFLDIHKESIPNHQTVYSKINALQPGDSFAMFVRRQNCMFVIHAPPNTALQEVYVATFPGNLHPDEVYKYDSDIEFNYPVQSIKVKFSEMLRSVDFAKQLCFMYANLPIEAKNRNYVSKWLMTLLTDESSEACTAAEFPIITKKIRDELLGTSKTNHFRRSSFYMGMKALLQHNLTVQLGLELGKFVYKLVMMNFLIQNCAFYLTPECTITDSIDLLAEMLAKMARRIEKLRSLKAETVASTAVYDDFYKTTVQQAKATIAQIRVKIDKHVEAKIAIKTTLPPLTNLNFDADIIQKMPKLAEYLKTREDDVAAQQRSNSKYQVQSYARYSYVDSSIRCSDMLGDRVAWMEFEKKVLYDMKVDDQRYSVVDLRRWSFEYASFAESDYSGNQLFISRMILVRLKLIAMLDHCAAQKHPLLSQHRSGINPDIITSLLLSQKIDMKIAHQLEEYFRQRNSKASPMGPSLIGEPKVTTYSFSTKYARANADMTAVRTAILAADANNLAEKRDEWSKARQRAESLRNKAYSLSCDYYYDSYKEVNRHSGSCEKCRLKREADDIRISEYEHLLPEDIAMQYAIAFELRIPKEIACLRDTLYGFAKYCTEPCEGLNIKYKWNSNRSEVSHYNQSHSEHVWLGSSTTYKLSTHHVDFSFDQFDVKNNSDCTFHASSSVRVPTSFPENAVKKVCTFQTYGEYKVLEWTIRTSKHTQNQVLALQSKCPQELSLSEYINFGSLRADGHRLQLRKLYAMLETEALSFEKESVLSLIMQTLWELGVSGSAAEIRESHSDFTVPEFCMETVKLLKKFMDQQQSNWKHPFKMVMAVLAAVRVFEINADAMVAEEIVEFLNGARSIALDWIDKISSAIHEMENPDEKIERELRLKLIYVGIAGALTFFVHPKHEHFERIFVVDIDYEGDEYSEEQMNKMTAPRLWLQFIVTVKNNLLMYTNNESSLPSNLRMFLRLIESIGVNLEPYITMLIQQNPSATVNGLIRKLWTRAGGAAFQSIQFHPKYPQILMVETMLGPDTQIVTIDIIAGIFLVDGLPVCRLPTEIMQNAMYRWFFDDVAFEVQPDAQKNYATVQKYNGCSYEFKATQPIVITERHTDGTVKELVFYQHLTNDFPYLLAKNYSHWWVKESNCIEFRKRTFGRKHFSRETTVDYQLDLQTNFLVQVSTKRCMIDVCSDSYKKIVHRLQRLEHSNYIHMFLDNPRRGKVELVRMNLKFKVDVSEDKDQHLELQSNEFSGMQVSSRQHVDTLFGLNHGLVLESGSDQNNRILLIPHGNIECKQTETHVTVHVDTASKLRTPPFFQYQVDTFCQQLKSNNLSFTAWFYLAYLHAITSHGEIDPFTGMSGTERAVQILQSAHVWSSAPYEEDAVKILHEIAKLSPIRDFREQKSIQRMQIVQWPEHVQPRAAQDCFVFIVKQLFDDSQRLHGLYFKDKPDTFSTAQSNSTAMLRDHHRCQPFNPNLRISDAFIKPKELRTSLPNQMRPSVSEQTQKVAILYHRQQYNVPSNIKSILKSHSSLTGMAGRTLLPNILEHSLYDGFDDLWIRLYDAARKEEFTREQFALILTVYAHRCNNIDLILSLQSVAANPRRFTDILPPNVNKFYLSHGTYSAQTVTNILQQHYSKPYEYDSAKWGRNGKREEHDAEYNAVLKAATSYVTDCWPCDSVNLVGKWSFSYINFSTANDVINASLLRWNDNRRFDIFMGEVEQRLMSLPASGLNLNQPSFMFAVRMEKNWLKFKVDFEVGVREHLNGFDEIINQAKIEWSMESTTASASARKPATEWWSILQQILNSNKTNHLINAGLFPRIIPSDLLPKTMSSTAAIDERLKTVIGAWAMAIAREQRLCRIRSYEKRPELQAALDRETENEPHVNWKPCDRPEWLLFEIEQNLTIREIQVKVAARMIDPPKMNESSYAKHSVMQLNMGEGKTAVIVPILAAVLADGKQTCQITVLKSLYATNLNSLRQYLGGMLNRRIYTFPCRRDMPIARHINQLLGIYEECKMKRGVILTLPEYRLSFQLKMYESIQKKDDAMANGILNVLKTINRDVRSILDESDAILQPKYQLIYTVGNQMSPDGGQLRWHIVQAVLKHVPGHMKRLWTECGKEKIEFDEKYIDNGHVFGASMVNYRGDVFTPCRILDETMFDRLKAALIDDFLGGRFDIDFPEIIAAKKAGLRSLLTHKVIDAAAFQVMDEFSLNEQNTILILSGLLRFEVLKLILTKRWRVNYGVDEKGRRKMAIIPFRAKDISAESCEFGHPDVAICFTQLSYYYSGLNDEQLFNVFNILENTPDALPTYEKWIQSIDQQLIDPSVKSYTGVNLDDPYQRETILFPLLRFNMHVIDFWLSTVVFPREMKIFESKLTCTAWDLCSDHFDHLVTGFSGTNDTKNILPLPIAQNDLQELENTNEHMRQVLLGPENRSYVALPANVSGIEILKRLTERAIPVLLDAGATMIELNNKQVAEEWLKLASFKEFDAAVFFDARDVLQTIDRNGVVVDYDGSVYRDNLSRCLVYLDDVHTRGTDLKFPLKWKAGVTLSGDITRDKTVQSCMRMRQLGKTHSISFWASFEADVRIRKLCNLTATDPVENEHVIAFICNNSRQFETANIVHWSAAGLNYTKKLIGHKLFENLMDEDETALENLYRWCVDAEFVELTTMYGEREEAMLMQIAKHKLDQFASNAQMTHDTRQFVEKVRLSLVGKLTVQAPNMKRFTHSLDEEQEKELEHELEEQREVERPGEAQPATPSFDKRLGQLVLNGVQPNLMQTMKSDGALMSMANSLSHTQLFQLIGIDASAWADHLLVTKDFKNVIACKTPTCDEFLRPVWWIAQIQNPQSAGQNVAILLSSYECNRLKPTFEKTKMATLFMYRARLSKFHSNLMEIPTLRLNGLAENLTHIDIHDEIQIGVYAGMMYFKTEEDSEAYCKFLGLILRPRSDELEQAFEDQIIQPKGFVAPENRHHSHEIAELVGQCRFQKNPVDWIIKLIEANRQTIPKAAHVASILMRGIKPDMSS